MVIQVELRCYTLPVRIDLDSVTYSSDATGRIRLRITQDPFTGGDLVKGKPYYFAITSYAVNHDALVNKLVDTTALIFGDYYLTSQFICRCSGECT